MDAGRRLPARAARPAVVSFRSAATNTRVTAELDEWQIELARLADGTRPISDILAASGAAVPGDELVQHLPQRREVAQHQQDAIAALDASGAQEVAITVKGGYTPDVIVVQKGRPVRLIFTRQESSACSEKVLFPDFNQNALLPQGEQVTLEITPAKEGEYGFQCQMGMLRGKLIVE